VDYYGFNAVVAIACSLQGILALMTFLYLVVCKCCIVERDKRLDLGDVIPPGVEQGEEVGRVSDINSILVS
jgi:hypothetical protein